MYISTLVYSYALRLASVERAVEVRVQVARAITTTSGSRSCSRRWSSPRLLRPHLLARKRSANRRLTRPQTRRRSTSKQTDPRISLNSTSALPTLSTHASRSLTSSFNHFLLLKVHFSLLLLYTALYSSAVPSTLLNLCTWFFNTKSL